MPDKDQLPSRGIPFRALVDANGVAVGGTATIAQLRQRGMQPVCQVDSSGAHSGGSTQAQLRSRGIPVFCEVDGVGAATGATLAQLRSRGIPAACMLDANGVAQGGTATIAQLRQRGIPYFCPLDENGDETTLSGGSFSAEATTLFAAMSSQPDGTRKTAIDTCIVALKDAGVWTLLDVLYVFAAHDAQASLLNWKNPGTFTATLTSTPTFEVDRGYTGNGSSTALDSNYNPATQAISYALDSACVFAWNVTANPTGQAMAGQVGSINVSVLPDSGDVNLRYVINDGTNTDVANGGKTGLFAASRASSTTKRGYRNGVQLGTAAVTSTSVASSNISFCRGSSSFFNGQVACGGAGADLPTTEQLALYNAMLAYMQAVGAA